MNIKCGDIFSQKGSQYTFIIKSSLISNDGFYSCGCYFQNNWAYHCPLSLNFLKENCSRCSLQYQLRNYV